MDASLRNPAPLAPPPGGHHTAEEIAQQPALWSALADALDGARAQIDGFLGDWLARPDHRVLFAGAGSSGFLAELVADAVQAQWPADVRALHTTRLLTHPALYLQRERPTLLVSFGRSGSSPESVAAVDLVRERVAVPRFLDITCNPDGALARRGAGRDDTLTLLMPPASCDRGFAMTSSLTCMQLAALAAFDRQPWPQRLARLRQVAECGRRALAEWDDGIAALAAGDAYSRVVYLGSGPLEALARESALKLLELSAGRVIALADTPLGFRHGPKSTLNGDALVVVLRSADPLARLYERDLLDELRREGVAGRVLSVGPRRDDGEDDFALAVPALPDPWLAPVWLTLAQRYALRRSAALGLSPDDPFPDGTVNRVVQGVTLHPGR
ncbi:SIS domain-containing protein [Luteimonas sp. Y-2-2-4F]|nr:SIS domain-containing protein [Luteimonas sp. Y-2-2-4F]MCD9032089.1 SIS domain-containing protein [Luteimonas sp. Y-2-2-4F]